MITNRFIVRHGQWWMRRGLPKDLSMRQAKWEFAEAATHANEYHMTPAREIGAAVGVTGQSVYQNIRWLEWRKRSRRASPVEEYFAGRAAG